MGSTEKFCLRWNDFESNISVAFQELREDKDFFDVTLACDDEQIQAHKVILSACSPFFRQILKRNRHEHPLLYLKGVKYIDLMSVLNFMYHGEVNVAQDELNSFLAIAEDLKVKGLTQNKSDNVPKQKQEIREIPVPKPQPRAPPERLELTPPPPKRQRPIQVPEPIIHIPVAPSYHQDDEIQEVVPVKSEPISHPQEAQIISDPHPANHIVVDANVDNSMSMYEENYNEYENYEEGNDAAYDGSMMTVANADANKDFHKTMIWSKIEKLGTGTYQCRECGLTKSSSGLTALKNHIEAKHLSGLVEYHCAICGKILPNSNQYNKHLTKHRSENASIE
eukprot:GFUD01045587.1.p1 GENE.GFUD01045587.1~~GFUD01045587.1.p1  ORF type:complete len:337 (-),score=63.10 GFUD01045587.1:112-1122(-)